MVVDAHQHFWHYSSREYPWIDRSLATLRRDYLPGELAGLLSASGIDGSVAVQARQTLEENEQLLGLARDNPFIRGVVGWAPLAERGSDVRGVLEPLARDPLFKGIRHVLQDEPDAYFSLPSFDAGLREAGALGLSYDLLIRSRQLVPSLALVDRHPGLVMVLDHAAKPAIEGPPPSEWLKPLRELARRDNVVCKVSGLVTEVAGGRWTPELLTRYFDALLEAFGPSRLMFGSDWPVCLAASTYGRWFSFVRACVEALSSDERRAILGGTAERTYRLKPQTRAP